jgi:L-2-hydroxyglutarate oxidase LhgO
MEDTVDVVVVGGGIVGCSVALELASRNLFSNIFLFERGPFLGDGTSTRNSYVIHAGIYYPEDSLKARFCVEGNRLQYEFCSRHGIPCEKTGKVIVAMSPEEVPTLETLLEQGQRNGAPGLRILDRAELKKVEPAVEAEAALLSPSTGVFDVATWFRVVEGLLFEQHAQVLKKTPVVGLFPEKDGVRVQTGSRGSVMSRFVVNAAGLYSDEVANLLGNRFRIHPLRGDYFSVSGPRAAMIRGAVYPTPGTIGLGIHLTRLWDGTLLVGPDARPVRSKDDYRDLPVLTEDGALDTDAEDFVRFYLSAKSFFPALKKEDFRLAHCGIRPALLAPGETGFRDFRIFRDPSEPRVIHLLGIDSPGLTSAPAIARHVAEMLEESNRSGPLLLGLN